MRFSAIDVETANPKMTSICQIGVATFDGGDLVSDWQTLAKSQHAQKRDVQL